MSRFGFCTSGKHDSCPGSYQPFYVDGKNVVRFHDGVIRTCSCPCHSKESNTQ